MTLSSKVSAAILAVIGLIGIVAYIYQLRQGLIVTDMNNLFSWGLYIVMWSLYVSIAVGALIIAAGIYIFDAEKFKPIAPVATLTALIFMIGGQLAIIADTGQPLRALFNFLLHPNLASPLPWDVAILQVSTLLAAVYTYVLLRPWIAEKGIGKKGLMRKGVSATELGKIKESSERQAKLLAGITLVVAVLARSIGAWVLATQLSRPSWFGGLLAPKLLAGAVASGAAVVILASLAVYGFRAELKQVYVRLAKIAAAAAGVLLFMDFNDLLVSSWWQAGKNFEVVRQVLREDLALHVLEVLFILAAIIILARTASKTGLIVGSAVLAVGEFLGKYLLIPSGFNVPSLTIGDWAYPKAVGELSGTLLNPQPVFVDHWSYLPSAVEISFTTGLLAILVLLLLGLLRVLPISIMAGGREDGVNQ